MLKKLAALVVVLGVVLAYTYWPRINDVETGVTAQYPDLKPVDYPAPPAEVERAALAAIAELPRWERVGSGSGREGYAIQAVATTRMWRFKDDVTIRLVAQGSGTRVSVHSKSRLGRYDFGQNARNIRAFLRALEHQMRTRGRG